MLKFNISTVELHRMMRMITLCSLGAAEPELPYSKIATALNISESEVEGFVVEAIGQGLMDATMNQFNNVVSVR